jgi:hypothetical protein
VADIFTDSYSEVKYSDENSKVSGGIVVSSVQFETEDYNV